MTTSIGKVRRIYLFFFLFPFYACNNYNPDLDQLSEIDSARKANRLSPEKNLALKKKNALDFYNKLGRINREIVSGKTNNFLKDSLRDYFASLENRIRILRLESSFVEFFDTTSEVYSPIKWPTISEGLDFLNFHYAEPFPPRSYLVTTKQDANETNNLRALEKLFYHALKEKPARYINIVQVEKYSAPRFINKNKKIVSPGSAPEIFEPGILSGNLLICDLNSGLVIDKYPLVVTNSDEIIASIKGTVLGAKSYASLDPEKQKVELIKDLGKNLIKNIRDIYQNKLQIITSLCDFD